MVDDGVTIGLKVTHHLNPAMKTPLEVRQQILEKLSKDMQKTLEMCQGVALFCCFKTAWCLPYRVLERRHSGRGHGLSYETETPMHSCWPLSINLG